jgi:hypothetical protein
MDETTKVTATARELMTIALNMPDNPNYSDEIDAIVALLVPDLEVRTYDISDFKGLCYELTQLHKFRAEEEARRLARQGAQEARAAERAADWVRELIGTYTGEYVEDECPF